jgi:hypothetical protein
MFVCVCMCVYCVTVLIGGFTYTLHGDGSGRVISAVGTVALKARGHLSAAANQICDSVYNPGAAGAAIYAGGAKRSRPTWQTGHMIASALGGNDADPINFFPQHQRSNGANGRWWRTEMIAGNVAAAFQSPGFTAVLAGCRVAVRYTNIVHITMMMNLYKLFT